MRLSEKIFGGFCAASTAIPGLLLLSGAESTAIGMASFAALGVCIATHEFWKRKGKAYLAHYIAKSMDTALKNQIDEAGRVLTTLIEKKVSPIPLPTSFVKTSLDTLVKEQLDQYKTSPELVANILEDIDLGRPSEYKALDKFAMSITNYVIKQRFFGFSFLRAPLQRIVSAVEDNFLKLSLEIIVKKMKERQIAKTVGTKVGKQFNVDTEKLITQETVAQVKSFQDSLVGSIINKMIEDKVGIDIAQEMNNHIGKSINDVVVSTTDEALNNNNLSSSLVSTIAKGMDFGLSQFAQKIAL